MQLDPRTVETLVRLFPTYAKYFGKRVTAKPKTKKAAEDEKKRSFRRQKPEKVEAPQLPMVNLLPPRLALAKARRNTRRAFAVAAAGLLTATGLVWVAQGWAIAEAQGSLTSAQNQVTQAGMASQKVSNYVAFFDSLRERYGLYKSLQSGQIDSGAVINLLSQAFPSGTKISTIGIAPMSQILTKDTANKTDLSANCGPVSDPYSTSPVAPVGCLSFSGTVTTRDQLTQATSTLMASKLLSNVTVVQKGTSTTSTQTGGIILGNNQPQDVQTETTISFEGTASINAAAAGGTQ